MERGVSTGDDYISRQSAGGLIDWARRPHAGDELVIGPERLQRHKRCRQFH